MVCFYLSLVPTSKHRRINTVSRGVGRYLTYGCPVVKLKTKKKKGLELIAMAAYSIADNQNQYL